MNIRAEKIHLLLINMKLTALIAVIETNAIFSEPVAVIGLLTKDELTVSILAFRSVTF